MSRSKKLFFYFLIIGLGLYACKTTSDDSNVSGIDDGRARAGAKIHPSKIWEIRTEHNETVVPDIFYAERSQNNQVMPTELTLKGAAGQPVRYKIDRMIYPTLGNPNLYIRNMPEEQIEDKFMIVLRVAQDDTPKYKKLDQALDAGRFKIGHSYIKFDDDVNNQFRFFVGMKHGRSCLEAPLMMSAGCNGTYQITPSAVVLQNAKNIPSTFAERHTIRFLFDKAAMGKVRLQIYDTRFELVRNGKLINYEFSYNSMRVFQDSPQAGNYNVLNITDSQMSTGSDDKPGKGDKFQDISYTQTATIVRHLVETLTAEIARPNANTPAFITFNGDLHNGGSPLTLTPEKVSTTYNREAVQSVELLRRLPLPIFLTMGNHDGYASTGRAPNFVNGNFFTRLFGMHTKLEKALANQKGTEIWESLSVREKKDVIRQIKHRYRARDLTDSQATTKFIKDAGMAMIEDFKKYLKKTKDQTGGLHNNIFGGTYVRRFTAHENGNAQLSWHEVPAEKRNVMLYDGLYQWRTTYGPSYTSWNYGKNAYINLNSYDLRQHRRTGWGMYTVNYGGGISSFQMGWINHQVDAATAAGKDIVLIAHHDPRGGHNGHDYPYYFRQVDYNGIGDSIKNYVVGEILNPVICNTIPEWAKSKDRKLGCLHDGLQEWMRPDPEFDCEECLLKGNKCKKEGIASDFLATNQKAFKTQRKGYLKCVKATSARLCAEAGRGRPNRNCDAEIARVKTEALAACASQSDNEYAKTCDTPRMQRSNVLHPNYSGYTLIHKLAVDKNIRTMLLGHTHYSSLEVFGPGTKLVPDSVVLDSISHKKWAALSVQNPVRNMSTGVDKNTPQNKASIYEDDAGFKRFLMRAGGHTYASKLKEHELVVMRLTTVADMSSQVFKGEDYYGYSKLGFTKKNYSKPGYVSDVAQLNEVTLYKFNKGSNNYGVVGGSESVGKLEIDRTKDVRYRKLDQIKTETSEGGGPGIESDYNYLKNLNPKYTDAANKWRNIFELKTEGETN